MRRWLIALFTGVFLAMLWVTVRASLDRNVVQAAGELWADPWARATLFDAYFAFLTVYLWIAYRETSWTARVVWFVLLMGLGNFAIAAYLIVALARLAPGEPVASLFARPSRGS